MIVRLTAIRGGRRRTACAGTRCGRGLARLPAGARTSVPAGLDDCMATLAMDARERRRARHRSGSDRGDGGERGRRPVGGRRAAQPRRGDRRCARRCSSIRCSTIAPRSRRITTAAVEFAWTPTSNRFGWTAYLGREPRMSDAPEYAAPARRDRSDRAAARLDRRRRSRPLLRRRASRTPKGSRPQGVAVHARHRSRHVSRRPTASSPKAESMLRRSAPA